MILRFSSSDVTRSLVRCLVQIAVHMGDPTRSVTFLCDGMSKSHGIPSSFQFVKFIVVAGSAPVSGISFAAAAMRGGL